MNQKNNARQPILVTGAAGKIGGVGFKTVELLCAEKIPVRAMVRRLDERSQALIKLGAEVVVGDLTDLQDVNRVIEGCKRIYFGMSVSPSYLEATANVAAVAKHYPIELFVNMSQMTVSEMSFTATTSSPQHKLQWLSEQVLNWSGLPCVHVRPTVFLDNPLFHQMAAKTIRESGEIKLPFGTGHTAPIATYDVARVLTKILSDPATSHVGKVYELTGLKSQDLEEIAQEYSSALGRPIKYVDMPIEEWASRELKPIGLPDHVYNHIYTMARMNRENRYDRLVSTVEDLTGVKPMSVKAWVQAHIADFQ